MKISNYLMVLLAIIVVTFSYAQEVDHQQAIDDAIAEAESETPATDEGAVPEPDPEPEPPVDDSNPPNLEENDAAPPTLADSDDSGDEILALPHLPDPKYDEDGDILWFPRIIGGSTARLGEFPSKISIQHRTGSHFCGGNLITYNHVISAAHCVVTETGHILNPASVEIMAGDISITRNPGPHRVFRVVSHIFVHTDYDSHTMDNDIAVLRVSVPFHPVQGILMVEPLAVGVPVTGTACTLAGWGATKEGVQRANPDLMRVDLDIVDTARCNISYQGLVPLNSFCAGTMKGGRDACQGDSGGGLICNGAITGIVSFGFGCGRPRFPGVYADVSAYTEFIEFSLNFDGSHDDIPQPVAPGSAMSGHRFSVWLCSLLAVILCLI